MGTISPDEAIQRLHRWDAQNNMKNEKRMSQAVALVLADAKRRCPVDEGHLRASTSGKVATVGKDVVGIIYNPLDYAVYVHQGTGIYAVEGNGRKTPWVWVGETKKWEGGHKTVGQRPQPFIKDAIEQNLGGIAAALSQGG